jgi:serine/threonine-protein kinase
MSSDDANYGSGGHAVGTTTAPPSGSRQLAQANTAPADPMIGTVIDSRYRVTAKLGEGGMGEVYACEHVGLKKRMAVKLLRAEIVTNEEAVRRFRQEAQSASAIKHKNIIEISDIGELPDKRVYMCMEFLEGAAFNDIIKQPIDPIRALHILIQTCDGLSAAHHHSIVHRDMKPENIFITTRDSAEVPKLLDFGIAKVSGNDGQNNLTRTGTIFGTPFYMAPEQALGQQVDHRADIYSIGVIMYEVFTGSVPFKADSFMAILTQHITTEPKHPDQMAAEHGRQIPPGITDIIVRCMRKEPTERYATMEELKGALVQAYRHLAGPGMSAYMDAAQGSAAYSMPQQRSGTGMQTPMPTPMPHHSMGPGATSHYGAQYEPQQNKSKAWLVILLFLVFLGGGGAAGYIYWQQQQEEDGDSSAEVVNNDPPVDDQKVDPLVTDPPVTDPPVTDPPVTDPVVVEVPTITVLVNSKPQGAEVFRDGESLGRTPLNVEVPEGQQTAFELERSGYHSTSFVLDGTKKKFTERLKKRKRGDPDHGKADGNDGKSDPFKDDKKDDKSDDKKDDRSDDKKDDKKIEDGLIDDDSDQLE